MIPGLTQISLGYVNAFLLEAQGELTLVDTGVRNSAPKIVAKAQQIGRSPSDIKNIVVTHLHADHTGSLKELKQLTGAPAWMHPADAEMVRAGRSMRPIAPGPGLIRRLMSVLVQRRRSGIEPTEIEHELEDGQVLDFAGGAEVIHAPGHAAGQIALWIGDQLLIAADAASNFLRLSYPIIFEDIEEGRRTLRRLADLRFGTAVFGHGKPIIGGASERFRAKWGVELD